MLLHRFFFLFLLLAGGASAQPVFKARQDSGANPWTHLRFHNDPDHFQFVVVSDRTGGHRDGVFEDAVAKINLLQPEFVVCVGDLIEGYTRDTAELSRQWQEFDSILRPLEVPFFYLPGNHDVSNDVMIQRWEQRHGRRYYHFVYKDVLFLCLDSNDGDDVMFGQQQVDYIKEALAANPDVRWTLLFMHHPLWDYAPYNGFDQVEAALADRPYTMFAGHTHNYMYSVRRDRKHYVLATTGGGSQLRGPRFGEFDHVGWVTMLPDGPRLVNLKLDGMIPHDILDSAGYRLAESLSRSARFTHGVFLPGGTFRREEAQPYVVRLHIENPGADTLAMQGHFYHHHHLDPAESELRASLPPASSRTLALRVSPVKSRLPRDPDPLALVWKLAFPQPPLQLPLALEGQYDIPLSSGPGLIEFTEMPLFLDSHHVTLSTPLQGTRIVYTLDGSEPGTQSPVYQEPILLRASTEVKARLLDSEGLMTEILSRRYEKSSPLAPVKVKKPRPGLAYRYFEGNFERLPDFSQLSPLKTGVAGDFDVAAAAGRIDHYAFVYEGYLEVPEDGVYTFFTRSDDGSKLFIGGQLVVDNDGSHSARTRKGYVVLKRGRHAFRLEYFEDFLGEELQVGYEIGGRRVSSLPFSHFSH